MRRALVLLAVVSTGGLVAAVATTSASVRVAQSAWSWGNPIPQGNTLRAVDFVAGRGYAAGDAGTVLRTDDGGSTWTGLATGTAANLARLQVVDADTLVVLGGDGCVLRRSDDGGATFRKIFIVVEQSCPAPLQAFTFVNDDVGYLLQRDGSILLTRDGGATFARQTAVPGTSASTGGGQQQPIDLAFTSATSGLVFTAPGGTGSAQAYATTDEGISWKPVTIPDGRVRRLHFLDAQNGFAVGSDTLLSTDDGGATWERRPAGVGRDLASIRCSDPMTCLMTLESGEILLRTIDGGATATEITASSQAVFAAAFASPMRVAAVGATGATVLSDDGGVNYTPLSRDIGGSYFGLRTGPGTSAFALGERGALAMTTDGGASWKTLAVPTSTGVADVSFPSSTTGYALDANGGLFKTANAGVSWQTLDTGTTAEPRALAAPSDDVVLLVGPEGIRRAVGASRFELVGGRTVNRASLDSIRIRPGVVTVWGRGSKALFRSTDQGETWVKMKLPSKRTEILATQNEDRPGTEVDFISPSVGFLLDDEGRVWKTANGGKKWAQILGVGSHAAVGLAMGSAADGFITGEGLGPDPKEAVLLRTSDGGRTWRPQSITPGLLVDAVSTDAQRAFALVGAPVQGFATPSGRNLFFTDRGGDSGAASTLSLATRTRKFTQTSLRRARNRVTVTGALAGAVGGEQVVVSRRDLAGATWSRQVVTAGANGGSFTTAWRIRRSSVFVAQWAGDSGRAGAGSAVLAVKVVEPKRKRRARRR